MHFNKHWDLKGAHAFLSPSTYHWIRYSDEKLVERLRTSQAALRGTQLHEFACTAIKLRQKLPRSPKTLNMYVNDAIGYGMTPEQILYYSQNAFGTVDAIKFSKDFLRIHDLKTGESKSSMDQLDVYGALFCLEYRIPPGDIEMEFRIYQDDGILLRTPDTEDIIRIMDTIVRFDRIINKINEEAE